MNGGMLRIGEIARQAGVNVQTLRYYEKRRLLPVPGRRPSGYREYPPETVQFIRFIRRAQDLGFTLSEIEELLALRKHGARRRAKVRSVAEAKLRDINEKIRSLEAIRQALLTLVRSCACQGKSPECPILEALSEEGNLRNLVPLGSGRSGSVRAAR